ncbi:hypothetical protein RRG08_024483 [Elysia crispata]|uniref:Uncharacterized protein n=1 Tax=Elysia crispata TaxID=231223 RepID=A0AAE1D308_9GAST|nr:hypothetical protein RRG08_024483 [Elysia crispata]
MGQEHNYGEITAAMHLPQDYGTSRTFCSHNISAVLLPHQSGAFSATLPNTRWRHNFPITPGQEGRGADAAKIPPGEKFQVSISPTGDQKQSVYAGGRKDNENRTEKRTSPTTVKMLRPGDIIRDKWRME